MVGSRIWVVIQGWRPVFSACGLATPSCSLMRLRRTGGKARRGLRPCLKRQKKSHPRRRRTLPSGFQAWRTACAARRNPCLEGAVETRKAPDWCPGPRGIFPGTAGRSGRSPALPYPPCCAKSIPQSFIDDKERLLKVLVLVLLWYLYSNRMVIG